MAFRTFSRATAPASAGFHCILGSRAPLLWQGVSLGPLRSRNLRGPPLPGGGGQCAPPPKPFLLQRLSSPGTRARGSRPHRGPGQPGGGGALELSRRQCGRVSIRFHELKVGSPVGRGWEGYTSLGSPGQQPRLCEMPRGSRPATVVPVTAGPSLEVYEVRPKTSCRKEIL